MIPNNLFNLSQTDINTCKAIYNGKVIKCLVAPYHSYTELEKIIPYSQYTYLFPEREMNMIQISNFIGMLSNSNINEDILIITCSQNIIINMIYCCVKILTQHNTIVDCPCKTFAANIHDIRYYILENEVYQINKKYDYATDNINDLIKKIQALNNSSTRSEKNALIEQAKLVGEPLIRTKLIKMIN
jgi:hypothetical protein